MRFTISVIYLTSMKKSSCLSTVSSVSIFLSIIIFTLVGRRDFKSVEYSMDGRNTKTLFVFPVTFPALLDPHEALNMTLESWNKFEENLRVRSGNAYMGRKIGVKVLIL